MPAMMNWSIWAIDISKEIAPSGSGCQLLTNELLGADSRPRTRSIRREAKISELAGNV
jgi:hypothetical protein